MAHSPISFVLALLLVLQWGWDLSSLALPQGRLPTFQLMSECDSAMCIKVTFADGEEDMIAANEYHEERHPNHDVFKGKLLSTNAKAVVILGEGDKKDLIVFKSSKVPACRKYRADLEAQGEASCMPGPNWEDILKNTTAEIDSLAPPTEEMETRTMEISTKERALNANGYILKVAVYYDDVWKEQFKENAETRIDAIMALVDEQYSENTFATEVDVEVVAVEYAKGENWNRQWYTGKTGAVLCYRPGCVDGDITAASPHDVNLWVFLTGSASRGGAAGMAWKGVLCSSNKAFRTSITKYLWEDEYTAEIVTHEIGHNLGLSHDFDDAIKRKTGKMVPRQVDGIDCKGYMDYNANNDGWSPCSVQDFTSYANRFGDDYCLAPIKDSNTGDEDNKEDEDSNNKKEVCVNIKLTTKTWGKEISWKFGSCESPAGYGENVRGKYGNNREYNIECCQPAGTYELDCKDKYGDGWHGGYIQIGNDETKYCESFETGKSQKQQVTVERHP